MDLNKIHNVYFIGIGGIGMSALAKYFVYLNKQVGGYDRVRTDLTDELAGYGAAIHFEDAVSSIPEAFKDVSATLVVFTPAIPSDHKELLFFRNNGFEVKKRAEVLGIITGNTFCFAVAGTHGKTTTASVLAHLLHECALPMHAFLGGVSEDFNSNFVCNGNDYSVVEADEFDRSFLWLSPDIACITSMDADHLDIYGDHHKLKMAFQEFIGKIKSNGKLIVRKGLAIPGITYGIEDGSDYCVQNALMQSGVWHFEVTTPKGIVRDLRFPKPGRHNLLNALAAFAMAFEAGMRTTNLKRALNSFQGVKRRFSYQIREENFCFIDDYAHHPTEIEAVHQAIREAHPKAKITVVFQPHLFSRTRDFIEGFATSLAKFDRVFLLEIYPAREQPIDNVNAAWLLDKIDHDYKKLIDKSTLVDEFLNYRTDVLLTIGAGDIGAMVPEIKNALTYAK